MAQTLEISTTPFTTPPRPSRRRADDEDGTQGEDGETPARPRQAMRRTVTGLPEDFAMPQVSLKETDNQMEALTGKDLSPGIAPLEAKVVYHKIYGGRKPNIGSASVVVSKDIHKAMLCLCFNTNPPEIGREVINVLNAKAEREGHPGTFKARLNGMEWIGVDPGGLTRKTTSLEKMGWMATPTTCKGAIAMMKLIKLLSAELLNANMPIDFYLCELTVAEGNIDKLKVILDILSRRITIDTTPEQEGDGAAASAASSALGVDTD